MTTLSERPQRAVALRDAATEGPWVEDDGHIYSKPLSEQAHDYVMRLLSDPEFHAMETDDQINRPVTEVATCSQDLPNFEADAALIAAAPSIVQLAVELGAECEALRVDAERYRWLRHGDNDESIMRTYAGESGARPFDARIDPCWIPRDVKLDTAIDAAMSKDKNNAQ